MKKFANQEFNYITFLKEALFLMEHADNLNTTFKYEETDLIKSSSKKSHVNNLTFQVFYQFSVKYCNLFQNCISVSVVISGITFFSICQNS